MSRHRRYFSLIEMIAVIVIIMIIAGISLSAFFKITKGKNVETSAVIVGSMLKAVRSYAITNNSYVALVLPNVSENQCPPLSGTSGVSYSNLSVLNPDYLYRSYRACVITYSGSTCIFSSWVADEKWEFLPKGTAIIAVASSAGQTNDFRSSTEVTNVNFSNMVGTTATTLHAPAIIFTPTGDIIGGKKIVAVGEVVYTNGSLTITNSSNVAYITVDQYTGRISYGSN